MKSSGVMIFVAGWRVDEYAEEKWHSIDGVLDILDIQVSAIRHEHGSTDIDLRSTFKPKFFRAALHSDLTSQLP